MAKQELAQTEASEALKQETQLAEMAKLKQAIAEAEYKAAKAQQDLAELSNPTAKVQSETAKAIAEANKAAIDAKREQFKGPSITVPKGTITTDSGTFIENRVIAHRTLRDCFAQFVEAYDAANENNKTLVLYHAADIKNLELLAAMQAQLQEMENGFTAAIQQAKGVLAKDPEPVIKIKALADPLLVGYAASGLLRTAADIVSLFKTTTAYTNFDVPVDENLITAALKSACPHWKIFNPAVYPINILQQSTSQSSAFINKLDALTRLNAEITQLVEAIDTKTATWKQALAEEKNADQKTQIANHLKKLEVNQIKLKALNANFSKLQTVLSTVDDQTKSSPLASILRAERLSTILNNPETYIVKVSVTSSGSSKISERLWRDTKIEFSGGTELSVVVYQPDGEVVFADIRYVYLPYQLSSDIVRGSAIEVNPE